MLGADSGPGRLRRGSWGLPQRQAPGKPIAGEAGRGGAAKRLPRRPGRGCHVSGEAPPHRHPPQPQLHRGADRTRLLPQSAAQPGGGAAAGGGGAGALRGRRGAPQASLPRLSPRAGPAGTFCPRRRGRPGPAQSQPGHPQASALRRRAGAGAGGRTPLQPRGAPSRAPPRSDPAAARRPQALRALPPQNPQPPGGARCPRARPRARLRHPPAGPAHMPGTSRGGPAGRGWERARAGPGLREARERALERGRLAQPARSSRHLRRPGSAPAACGSICFPLARSANRGLLAFRPALPRNGS